MLKTNVKAENSEESPLKSLLTLGEGGMNGGVGVKPHERCNLSSSAQSLPLSASHLTTQSPSASILAEQLALDKHGDLDWTYTAKCLKNWTPSDLAAHLCETVMFSVPAREFNRSAPFVQVRVCVGGAGAGLKQEIVTLPHGYRLPLMFLTRYLWEMSYQVLKASTSTPSMATASSASTTPGLSQSSHPDAQWVHSSMAQILHFARSIQHLLTRAKVKATVGGGMMKGWRCLMFDRLLARFYKHCRRNDPESNAKFLKDYGAKEYERDVLRHDWKRWCLNLRGIPGVRFTEDDVNNGLTATQFVGRLRDHLSRISSLNSKLFEAMLTEDPSKAKEKENGWSSGSELTDMDIEGESEEDVKVHVTAKTKANPTAAPSPITSLITASASSAGVTHTPSTQSRPRPRPRSDTRHVKSSPIAGANSTPSSTVPTKPSNGSTTASPTVTKVSNSTPSQLNGMKHKEHATLGQRQGRMVVELDYVKVSRVPPSLRSISSAGGSGDMLPPPTTPLVTPTAIMASIIKDGQNAKMPLSNNAEKPPLNSVPVVGSTSSGFNSPHTILQDEDHQAASPTFGALSSPPTTPSAPIPTSASDPVYTTPPTSQSPRKDAASPMHRAEDTRTEGFQSSPSSVLSRNPATQTPRRSSARLTHARGRLNIASGSERHENHPKAIEKNAPATGRGNVNENAILGGMKATKVDENAVHPTGSSKGKEKETGSNPTEQSQRERSGSLSSLSSIHSNLDRAGIRGRSRSRSSSVEIVHVSMRPKIKMPGKATGGKRGPPRRGLVLAPGRTESGTPVDVDVDREVRRKTTRDNLQDSEEGDDVRSRKRQRTKKGQVGDAEESEEEKSVVQRALELLLKLRDTKGVLRLDGDGGYQIGYPSGSGADGHTVQTSDSSSEEHRLEVELVKGKLQTLETRFDGYDMKLDGVKDDLEGFDGRLGSLEKARDAEKARMVAGAITGDMQTDTGGGHHERDGDVVMGNSTTKKTADIAIQVDGALSANETEDDFGATPSRSLKIPSLDGRVDEIRDNLSQIVENLVSSKMLSVMQGIGSSKPKQNLGSASGTDTPTRIGSPLTSTSLGPSSSIGSMSLGGNDRCAGSGSTSTSIDAPDGILIGNLLDEIKGLKQEARARELRDKEDMQAMRQLHSAEIDALRRRLVYLEGQMPLGGTRDYGYEQGYHPRWMGYPARDDIPMPVSAPQMGHGRDWESDSRRYRESQDAYPHHSERYRTEQESASTSAPGGVSTNGRTPSGVNGRSTGGVTQIEDDGPLPIKSQRKQHIVGFSRGGVV